MSACDSRRYFLNHRFLSILWSRHFLSENQQRNQPFQLSFISRQYNYNVTSKASKTKPKESWEKKLVVLTKILKHPPDMVRILLRKGQCLLNGNDEGMAETWKILVNHGFGLGVLNEYPRLLLKTPASTQNAILIMKESKFHTIRPYMILNYKTVAETSLGSLKDRSFIQEDANVLQNYFQILSLPNKLEQQAKDALGKHESEMSLLEIRMFLLVHFLSYRLEVPLVEMKNILLKIPRSKHRSLHWVSRNLDILMEDLKLSKDKIKKNAYLLQSDPSRLSDIVALPTLCGMSIVEMANVRPKILMSTAESLSEIDVLFKQFGISSATIKKYPELYTLQPSTIRARLEELDRIPQFTTFKCHPRVGRVICYQKKVKERLENLASMNVHGVSLYILSTNKKRFDKFVKLGEIINKGADIIHFVTNYFGKKIDRVQIRQNLLVHPNWLHVPVINVKATLQFLMVTKGFQVHQLMKGLPIILYPIEKIQEAMDKIKENGEAEEEDNYYMQMVLYFIESPGHFSGSGTWLCNSSPVEEIETELEVEDSRLQGCMSFLKNKNIGVHAHLGIDEYEESDFIGGEEYFLEDSALEISRLGRI